MYRSLSIRFLSLKTPKLQERLCQKRVVAMAAPPIAIFDRGRNACRFSRERFLQCLHDNRRILSFWFLRQASERALASPHSRQLQIENGVTLVQALREKDRVRAAPVEVVMVITPSCELRIADAFRAALEPRACWEKASWTTV
jgi:hypothetical protein